MNKLELIEKLEDELALLKKQVTDEEQWHSSGGFSVYDPGIVYMSFKQAEKAAEAMRIHNSLLAYVDDFDPNWKADWDDFTQPKWRVYKDINKEQWHSSGGFSVYDPGIVYMSAECAEFLVKELNSGFLILFPRRKTMNKLELK